MKIKKISNRILWVIMLSVFTMIGCKKMNSSYKDFLDGGEKRFSKIPDSVSIFPGNGRIGFQVLLSDPNIQACRIYWNFNEDSVEMPVDAIGKGTDTVSFIIDSLKEGRYEFTIYTIDRDDNFSIGFDTTATVYGAKYQSGLSNRGVVHAELLSGDPRIYWLDAVDSTSLGVRLSYNTQDEKPETVFVPNEEQVTKIKERPLGDSLQITTIYIPGPGAIDTFYSTPKTIILHPAQPKELIKSNFAAYDLPGDAPAYSGYSITALWDNKYYDIADSYKAGDQDKDGLVFPLSLTLDLGTTAVLDHFILWQMGADHTSYFYGNANVKKFEVWGSAEEPDPDGSWDSWTKLSEDEVIMPSYDAIDVALAGHEFNLPDGTPAVRYIRIKVLETWKDYPTENRFFIQELSFYGIEE